MENTNKILLIEDNLEMRENTAEILELAGYNVITAENGKIGVKKAQEIIPDIVICDIMMPELDGYGVLHLLAKDTKTMAIPFIFLTAKAEKSDMRKGMNLGADDYLSKPYDDTELLKAVEIRLNRSKKFKTTFERTENGINQFLSDVSGILSLNDLTKNRKIKSFKKKEFIYVEDSKPILLYFIVSGRVKTFKTNDFGKDFIIDLYKEGDFFGYDALLEESSYTNSAEALEDCEIMVIPKDDFFTLLFQNREVSAQFIKMLSNELKEKEERMLKLAYNSVRKRVAEGLILLSDRYKKENENQFSISISRENLSNIAGTASETAIRTLSDFKDENLIEIKGSLITILNEDKLRNLRN
jgi:CRP-like cAMP-binding protein/CheY-like chemotaxis protein